MELTEAQPYLPVQRCNVSMTNLQEQCVVGDVHTNSIEGV